MVTPSLAQENYVNFCTTRNTVMKILEKQPIVSTCAFLSVSPLFLFCTSFFFTHISFSISCISLPHLSYELLSLSHLFLLYLFYPYLFFSCTSLFSFAPHSPFPPSLFTSSSFPFPLCLSHLFLFLFILKYMILMTSI